MSTPFQNVFHPVEGAVLDLDSLQAISGAIDSIEASWLATTWPGAAGMVLEGLELAGDWSSDGPPGTRRPDPRSESVVITPGRALVTGRNGRRYLIHLDHELKARWPTRARSAVEGSLVLVPRIEPATAGEDVVVAREKVSAVLGFVKPDLEEKEGVLPLARSIGNGQDWATDLWRVWQPEHEAVQILLKRFDQIERTVWTAEPEGGVWDRQVLGRNWVRYQTVAASAVQSARMVLAVRASTTLERVRLLGRLYEQLHRSVERAANELLQVIGPPESAGPYGVVGPQTRG